MRQTFNKLLAEYGAVFVVVYFTLFFGVLLGAWAAVRYGWDPRPLIARIGLNPNGLVAAAGPWVIAYGVAKITQPVRIGATLVLTPLVAKLWMRLSGRRPAPIVAPGGGATRAE